MRAAASVGAAVAIVLGGCSAAQVGDTPEPSRTAEVSASAQPTPNPTPTATPGTCNPLEYGGPCLGELLAGTYTTTLFKPSITYNVLDYWANWEDLSGSFLVVPPGETLEGVHADTSDFIGIYRGVAAAAANCDALPEPGVGSSSQALADWFTANPGLHASEPQPVVAGGLSGLVLDLTLAEGWTGTCPYAHAGEPLVPLIIGTGPASLHHVLNASFTTRLYLLDVEGGNIVIEAVDHPGGLGMANMDEYARWVDAIQFGAP
jgi:hypothetical protein